MLGTVNDTLSKYNVDLEDIGPMIMYTIASLIGVNLMTSPTFLPDLSGGGYSLTATAFGQPVWLLIALSAVGVAYATNQEGRRKAMRDRLDNEEIVAGSMSVISVLGVEHIVEVSNAVSGSVLAQSIVFALGLVGFAVVAHK